MSMLARLGKQRLTFHRKCLGFLVPMGLCTTAQLFRTGLMSRKTSIPIISPRFHIQLAEQTNPYITFGFW